MNPTLEQMERAVVLLDYLLEQEYISGIQHSIRGRTIVVSIIAHALAAERQAGRRDAMPLVCSYCKSNRPVERRGDHWYHPITLELGGRPTDVSSVCQATEIRALLEETR